MDLWIKLMLLYSCCFGASAEFDGRWPRQMASSNGLCRYGARVDCCWGWTRRSWGHCQPLCQPGCKHGDCVGPNKCKCHPGFTGKTCNQEEELDYLTPPMWASHLPIFLPVDHQPAREVMEGEICRSASPRAASLLPHLSNMHGATLCCTERGGWSECPSSLFSYCFLSSSDRRDTTQEQLFSRNANTNAKHVTALTTQHLPLFLSPSALKISLSAVPKSPHDSSSSCRRLRSHFSLQFLEHLEQVAPPSLQNHH